MFEKLKSGFKGLVTKVTTAELKPDNLRPILSNFKFTLAENDVAFPVADKVCDEMEKRLTGMQVKRLERPQKIVEDNLRQVLLDVMLTDKKIDILAKAEEKRKQKEPLSCCL
jgi:signal recognition particle GTPase